MDIRLEKLELIEMLMRTDKESVLKKIRNIFEQEPEYDTLLTDTQIEIVAERREEYLRGEGKYFSMQEVKNRIANKTSE